MAHLDILFKVSNIMQTIITDCYLSKMIGVR